MSSRTSRFWRDSPPMGRRAHMKRQREKRKLRRGTAPSSTPQQRSCTRKAKYQRTFPVLTAFVRKIMNETVHIGGVGVNGLLNAYRCRRCEHWHVGHSRMPERAST